MRYAINLNLDYENNSPQTVRALFREVRAGLIAAGFRRDGRLFTIALPGPDARALARQVLESVAERGGYGDPYRYVQEFYGFDFDQSVNMLLPPSGEIGVEELSAEFEASPLAATSR